MGQGTSVVPLAERVGGLFAGNPGLIADPYPTWNELREQHPVWRFADTVILSRHRDVREMLGDNNQLYSRAGTRHSARYEAARARFSPEEREAFDNVMDNEFRQLVRLDPPDHPRLRRLVQTPFSVKSLTNEMEDKVRYRVDSLLEEAGREAGIVDFKRFAYTLPLKVLSDLLGIPLTDLDQVHALAHKIGANKFNADSGPKAVEAEAAYRGLNAYIEALLERQREGSNATGVVGALLDAEARGYISHDECMAMIALMIFAGHETTSNLLAIGLYELLRHPDQWELFCENPSLAPQAVEELLRFVTPAHFLPYVATRDRELSGVPIAAGTAMIGVLAGANRDPEVFENPDVLDITRVDSKNHVSLGFGPHFCLGAALARMEATRLFRALAERFPRVELVSESIPWGGSGSLRTPLELPVRLRP